MKKKNPKRMKMTMRIEKKENYNHIILSWCCYCCCLLFQYSQYSSILELNYNFTLDDYSWINLVSLSCFIVSLKRLFLSYFYFVVKLRSLLNLTWKLQNTSKWLISCSQNVSKIYSHLMYYMLRISIFSNLLWCVIFMII
jgi:hypothetical protein